MITKQQLKEQLSYDKDTGIFVRLKSMSNKTRVGDVAGGKETSGYIRISLFGRTYKAHRLVWLYVYGVMPDGEIDHINLIKDDNRLCNLRQVSMEQNQWNRANRVDNKSGVKGVHFCKTWKKWIAACRVNGVRHHIGRFDDLKEAEVAVVSFRRTHHGEYAR